MSPRRAAFLLALAALTAAPSTRAGEDEHEDNPEERFTWWHRQRALPATLIPIDAWTRARRPFRAPRRAPRGAAPITWQTLGPAPLDNAGVTPSMGPSAGRASVLTVDPTNPKTLYAGYAVGGAWKSTDGGATWTPILDLQPTLAVGAIAVDPTSPKILYIGTGEAAPYVGYSGQGILRSTDGGATFDKIGGAAFDDLSVGRIIIDPGAGALYASATFGARGRGQNCNVDYDAPGQGLYRSTDGGATWTLLRAGKIIDLEIDTSVTPRRILISDYTSGAFRSEDGGATFTAAGGLPTVQGGARRIELSFSPKNPDIVYAGLGLSGASTVYISADFGKTFTQIPGAPDYCETQCYYDNAVAVDPADEKTVYLGGGICGVWKSADATSPQPTWVNVSLPNHDCKGGQAWKTAFVHPDIHAVTFDPKTPGTVYFATDGGVARTADGGATFTQLNQGVGTLQVYSLCGDKDGSGVIHGGAQDNGVFTGGTSAFRAVLSADGGPCAVDPTDPQRVMASAQYATLYFTKNTFATLPAQVFTTNGCSPGQPGCGDRSTFIAPMVGDPTAPDTYYVGTHRVWKTDAAGAAGSWKALSGDLTAGEISVPCPDAKAFGKLDDALTALAVAPSDNRVIYTGSQAGWIFGSRDGGATWDRLDKAPLPGRWVTALTVDPRDARVVFASFSGFGDATPGAPGHVFRSADGGLTWALRDIPADTPVNTVLAHPTAADLVYAGTDAGVLFTTDGGVTWSPLGEGMPSVPVYSLLFQRAASALVAGTFGRSAWKLGLPAGAVLVTPDKLLYDGRGAPPQAALVAAADPRGGATRFSIAASAPWVSVDTAAGEVAGAAGAQVMVSVKADRLAPGTHDAEITFTPEGGGEVVKVPVRLTLSAPSTKDPDKGCGCRVGASRGGAAGAGLSVISAIGLLYARRRRRSAR